MKFTWKRHPEFKNYLISMCGCVFSLHTRKVLKYQTNIDGYKVLTLCDKVYGKKLKRVNRITAETFLGLSDLVVNHKDGDKLNNHISNLEFVSVAENNRHAFKMGLNVGKKGEESGRSKITKETVLKIHEESQGRITNQKLADKYGVSNALVSLIKNRKTWKHLLD